MSIKQNIQNRISRIAETHFFLRPVLVTALKKHIIPEDAKRIFLGSGTYHEYWEKLLSDKFYDMGTLIRLGSEVEICLRDYYMAKKGYKNLTELRSDPKYKRGIFQRILPWQNSTNDAISLFQTELGYDLNTNPHFKLMQEQMVLRHLYAHNTGIIDDQFIQAYKDLKGEDVTTITPLGGGTYPDEDVYFFEPLARVKDFIEGTKKFFSEFPE